MFGGQTLAGDGGEGEKIVKEKRANRREKRVLLLSFASSLLAFFIFNFSFIFSLCLCASV
jgi:hypothetical protein